MIRSHAVRHADVDPGSANTKVAFQGLTSANQVMADLPAGSISADVVLAAAAYGEKSGTTTNIEGRVSTVSEKVTPRGTSRPL